MNISNEQRRIAEIQTELVELGIKKERVNFNITPDELTELLDAFERQLVARKKFLGITDK